MVRCVFYFLFFVAQCLFALTPQEALIKLQEGNKRFVSDKSSMCLAQKEDRRKAFLNNQKPFAIILGCSDSRVPPEILFDQGIGDLFIIRVAGNVLGLSEIDSITYAVKALGCPLIIVLGHENCGAVDAVWQKKGDMIPFINKEIEPYLNHSDSACTLSCQVKNNVKHIVDVLNKTPQFTEELKTGRLKTVGAFYPFVSGEVEFLSQ